MSRRNRSGNSTTFVNNVRGPTSALTSFLNERGIRRANPAPRPATPPPAVEDESSQGDLEEEEETSTAASSSTPPSRSTRTARLTRGRTLPTPTPTSRTTTTRSESESSSDDDDDDEEEEERLIPIAVTVRSTRSVRTRAAIASTSSSKATASSSKAAASSSKAVASSSKAAGPSKKRRKKDDSDDSEDEEFHDITGYVSRSKFSHKGRMPQGSNRIEFCSRCRARFTIKAGTSPAVDEDDGGLLCPTCAGEESAPNVTPKPKPAKRARRKQQKADIESQVPTLQDLCIQKIASCIEDVEAFGDISEISMDKICKIISRNRSLNTDTVHLFLDTRHTDLSLYDCTDITADGLQNIAKFCPNLRSLKLKFCGRINDTVMNYYAEHLTQLSSLSLIGPILITEAIYIKLFKTVGERLERFELKHSARFSLNALKALCEHCPNLTHLRLGDLNLMNDDWIEPITGLTKLVSLRLRNPERERMTTESLVKLIQTVGSGLVELELKGFVSVEDPVLLEAIRPSCVRLQRLNILGCEEFTTEAVETLFKDWSTNGGLTYLNLENCVMLGDAALEAITAHSGATLEDLNIKGLDELTKESLLTLARCENLGSLDASWCRAMDDEVLEKLVEAAPKLAKVIVWGDHRLTECCPSRKGMKVVGREGDYIDLRFM
ncbi:hypothetical protein BGZ99_007184 [Dissophora globulifera]|uniref:RNI-like protein n=1 Tax=Dissophora globulifera TaxID=979702 RepID=A0A9P6UQY6_9FUNG|nr:hypothetical protein BGZ99_007184 [Dissophora globulifera]